MTDVILDTDIGDDIDDAYALTFLARSSELNLIGVTTSSGTPASAPVRAQRDSR